MSSTSFDENRTALCLSFLYDLVSFYGHIPVDVDTRELTADAARSPLKYGNDRPVPELGRQKYRHRLVLHY